MPAGRESIANTPLAGNEVRDLIMEDTRRMIEAHGLLSSHVAYGRIGYEVIVRLHLANAVFDDMTVSTRGLHDTSIKSRPIARNIVQDHDELRAIETPPLAGVDEDTSVVLGEKVTRNITSPNAERLRAGLPIPTMVRNQDGSYRTEFVKREAQPDLGPGDVRIMDDTAAARADWGLPPEVIDSPEPDVQRADPFAGTVAPPMESPEDERRRKIDGFFGEGTYDARKAEEDAASNPPQTTTTT